MSFLLHESTNLGYLIEWINVTKKHTVFVKRNLRKFQMMRCTVNSQVDESNTEQFGHSSQNSVCRKRGVDNRLINTQTQWWKHHAAGMCFCSRGAETSPERERLMQKIKSNAESLPKCSCPRERGEDLNLNKNVTKRTQLKKTSGFRKHLLRTCGEPEVQNT